LKRGLLLPVLHVHHVAPRHGDVRGLAAAGAAVVERVAFVAGGAGTHRDVVLAPADCVGAAHASGGGRAGVLTVVVVAGLMQRTLVALGALAQDAPNQRVARVPPRAGAHGAVVALLVVAGVALGVLPTGVGVAQVGWGEFATLVVRVPRVGARAAADGFVVLNPAQRVLPTHRGGGLRAGVDALQLVAGFPVRAFGVVSTLRVATSKRVALEELRAGAFGLPPHRFADRTGAARAFVAGVGTLVVPALIVLVGAVIGGVALGPALDQRIADVVSLARAHGAAILFRAHGVMAARAHVADL